MKTKCKIGNKLPAFSFSLSNEKTIKTSTGLKVELTRKNTYELVRIYGHKGYVEAYGRPEIQAFVRALTKGFKIV